jgi:hypothetical protein
MLRVQVEDEVRVALRAEVRAEVRLEVLDQELSAERESHAVRLKLVQQELDAALSRALADGRGEHSLELARQLGQMKAMHAAEVSTM